MSFPLVEAGPVDPMLKEIRKESMKTLSLAFRQTALIKAATSILRGSFQSLRNLPRQKRLLDRSHGDREI